MDHQLAEQTNAVERYFLKQMDDEERNAFEDHYFSCSICAEGVCTAAALVDNAKSILRMERSNPSEPVARPGWMGMLAAWFRPQVLVPAMAALGLAIVVGYQNFVVIPGMRAPVALSPALILDGATRAALPSISAGQPLEFTVSPDPLAGKQVVAELSSSSGRILARGAVGTVAPDRPFTVYFPGQYAAGQYTLAIRDVGTGQQLFRELFEVTAKENSSNAR